MTPRRLRRPVAAAAFAALWVLSIAPAAYAHAELATMTPADKSTVPIPAEIVATFTENLDPSGSNLVLLDSGGKVVAQGGTVDAADPKKLTLDLASTPLGEATYTVRWTSKSADDGDLDRGTTTFLTIAGPSMPASGATASTLPRASASAGSSGPPSVAASPSPSAGTATPASSTGDALIPVVVVLVALALLGLWLLRGRSRRAA